MPEHSENIIERVCLDKAGRIVVPASIRRLLKVSAGQSFIVSVTREPPSHVIEMRTIESAIERAQAIAEEKRKGCEGSVVDEFIAQRRTEALTESESWPK